MIRFSAYGVGNKHGIRHAFLFACIEHLRLTLIQPMVCDGLNLLKNSISSDA
jgi:hypothetical protein